CGYRRRRTEIRFRAREKPRSRRAASARAAAVISSLECEGKQSDAIDASSPYGCYRRAIDDDERARGVSHGCFENRNAARARADREGARKRSRSKANRAACGSRK